MVVSQPKQVMRRAVRPEQRKTQTGVVFLYRHNLAQSLGPFSPSLGSFGGYVWAEYPRSNPVNLLATEP